MTGLPIRAVILAMFEPAPGDTVFIEGEMRRWVERLPLGESVPFPFGGGALRVDRERGILCMLTGVGNVSAACAVTALGLHPEFDLTRAYWLMAGIGGADPDRMPVGSAAWIDWVVDGELMHEIDRGEAPAAWTTGRFPLGKAEPFAPPATPRFATHAWRIEPGLLNWAVGLTRDIALVDTAEMAAFRADFFATEAGALPPRILTGSVVGGSDFWHGWTLLHWARGWTDYWTGGQGRFVVSAMEDTGIAMALHALGRAGRADARRLLMLRTASNYVVPKPGRTAAESLGGDKSGAAAALKPSLESAYLVMRPVLDALLADWPRWRDEMPA
jgi:purine nucleoside permease